MILLFSVTGGIRLDHALQRHNAGRRQGRAIRQQRPRGAGSLGLQGQESTREGPYNVVY